MKTYRNKNATVEAIRFEPDGSNSMDFDGTEPIFRGMSLWPIIPGNWVVNDGDRMHQMTHEEFISKYEPVEPEPKNLSYREREELERLYLIGLIANRLLDLGIPQWAGVAYVAGNSPWMFDHRHGKIGLLSLNIPNARWAWENIDKLQEFVKRTNVYR